MPVDLNRLRAERDEKVISYIQSGKKCLDEDDWPGAEIVFGAVLSLAPNNYEAHLSMGDAKFGLEKYQEAIPHFQRAIELEPEAVEPKVGLARSFYMTKRWNEVLPLLEAICLKDREKSIRIFMEMHFLFSRILFEYFFRIHLGSFSVTSNQESKGA
jgi:tetratricopeptide (TPR) repeat protein